MRKRLHKRLRKRFLGSAFMGVLLVATTAISGCSSVPDSVNPVEWYKSAKDVITGTSNAPQSAKDAGAAKGSLVADRGKPAPGADKPFPNLASVPEGLPSDKRKRKYAPGAVHFQGKSEQSLADKKESVAVSSAPPPPVMPVAPVTPVAIAKPQPPSPTVSAPSVTVSNHVTVSKHITASNQLQKKRLSSIKVSAMSAHSEGLSEFAPAVIGGVEKTFQARISQRRPVRTDNQSSALSSSGATDQAPASVRLPAGPGGLQTVVISSSGLKRGQGSSDRVVATAKIRTATPPAAQPKTGLTGNAKKPLKGSIKVATIQFPNGSARLDAPSRRVLVDVSRLLHHGGGKVRVSGYASSRTREMDPISHKMVNYRISADRADVVARELVRLGVPKDNIVVDARSDSMPVYYESMPSGEAGNRRAEIFIEH